MSPLKILLLENPIFTQQALVKMLNWLGHHNVFTAANSIEATALLALEKHFDVLIVNISEEHTQEFSFIRQANDIGHIQSLLFTSGTESSIRQAIQQLARLWGYQVIGDICHPISISDLETSLSKHKRISQQHVLHLTEMFSAADIKTGINGSQFTPYYQPKFDINTLEITGAEVLTRWKHPIHGLISPAAFLDVARHFDYLDEMMQDVMQKALRFLKANEKSRKLGLSINIDATQLRNPNFHKHFKQLLACEKIDASKITLEITEESAIDSPANCLENLINLRFLGCGISIDDFGAGQSSLQRICDLPCTEIKLDMSFTRTLTSNEKSKAAIQNMLNLSNNIGTQLVIEGVEEEEQVKLLRDMNCRVGQGYFFSPPVTGDELVSMLAKQKSDSINRPLNHISVVA